MVAWTKVGKARSQCVYVDLVTGDLHPAIEGGLNKNLGTGKGYLGRLAERDPARSGFTKSGAQ